MFCFVKTHPLNQTIAKALLKEKGVLVDIAENGQEGCNSLC